MKNWTDLAPETRDMWRQNEVTQAAFAMLKTLLDRANGGVIAAASNTGANAERATTFAAGLHEGLRLTLSNLTTEPK